jgi:hypothetical protein
MTQYEEKVQKQKLKNDAEAWGKMVKHIHFNNDIEEIKYNNGKIVQKNIKTGHVDYFNPTSSGSLIDKFQRALADMRK